MRPQNSQNGFVCFFLCTVAGEAASPRRASAPTRVAAEGEFPCGCVGLGDAEIPVLVNAHGGGVGVPAGVGEEQVLKARQHLRAENKSRGQEAPSQQLVD